MKRTMILMGYTVFFGLFACKTTSSKRKQKGGHSSLTEDLKQEDGESESCAEAKKILIEAGLYAGVFQKKDANYELIRTFTGLKGSKKISWGLSDNSTNREVSDSREKNLDRNVQTATDNIAAQDNNTKLFALIQKIVVTAPMKYVADFPTEVQQKMKELFKAQTNIKKCKY